MDNDSVDQILNGSFDFHVYSSPDPYSVRRMDGLDTARLAYEVEMSGFVLNSDYYSTAPLASALQRMYPGLLVTGSITLNDSVGGINPQAVLIAAKLGARVVYMPTTSADFWLKQKKLGSGISLFKKRGHLDPLLSEILDIIVSEDMILATGKVSPQESINLLNRAQEVGVKRMIVNDMSQIASADELKEMAATGAMIEHTMLSCMPTERRLSPTQLADAIYTVGVSNSILSTHFGQIENPPPSEGMRMAIAMLLNEGMPPDDISKLVKKTPLNLIRKPTLN
jgi:hypothetical protein